MIDTNSRALLPSSDIYEDSVTKTVVGNEIALPHRVEHGVDWKNVQLMTTPISNELDVLNAALTRNYR